MAVNPFENAHSMMTQAGDTFSGMADGSFMGNINKYINPYYEQVLGDTINNMSRQKDIAMGGIGDAAISAGAFGGKRHGVAEGTLLGDFTRNVGDITNQVSSQAFGQGFQNMFNSMNTGATNLMGLGNQFYGIGNDIADRQMDTGNMQQDLMNQILQGGEQSFNNMMGSPDKIINMFNAILAGDPRRNAGQTTGTSTPGLFDYLSLVAQTVGGVV